MVDTQRLSGLPDHLSREIRQARASFQGPLSPADITSIVRQVVESLGGDASAADVKFFSELEELARYIRQAKHEIVSIKPKDISTDHIPRATDELDAVVGATEEATNRIMDVCDEVTAIAGSCSPDINEKLIACTTRIFEACNFQDITGQRITKVVETLKHIDIKIEALVRALGDEIHRDDDKGDVRHLPGADPEKALLNGPALPQNATSQDEIDRLMSGL